MPATGPRAFGRYQARGRWIQWTDLARLDGSIGSSRTDSNRRYRLWAQCFKSSTNVASGSIHWRRKASMVFNARAPSRQRSIGPFDPKTGRSPWLSGDNHVQVAHVLGCLDTTIVFSCGGTTTLRAERQNNRCAPGSWVRGIFPGLVAGLHALKHRAQKKERRTLGSVNLSDRPEGRVCADWRFQYRWIRRALRKVARSIKMDR